MSFKKIIHFLPILVAMMASCSKEPVTGVKDGSYNGAKLVSFNNYAGYIKYNAIIENKLDTVSFQIKLGNTTSTAESPIRVTLVRDNAVVSEYNSLNGTSLVSIPVNNIYLLDDVVTFQAGQRIANFKVVFNPTRLGGGTVLGVTIAKVEGDGATVINDINQNRVVIEIGALNAYDGLYSLKGAFVGHPTYAGPFNAGATIELRTSGITSIDQFCTLFNEYCQPFSITPGDPTDLNRFGALAVTYTVNPNNSVTISSGPGNTTALEYSVAGYTNRYDPASKTFFVSYGYRNAAGALRQFIDTLTYVRPR